MGLDGLAVLVIEDDQVQSQLIVKGFETRGCALVDTAFSIAEAREILLATSSARWLPYDVIVVDACVPGHTYNTRPLIRHLVEGEFPGVLVAASSLPEYRDLQMKDGCTLNGGKTKTGIPEVVARELARLSTLK